MFPLVLCSTGKAFPAHISLGMRVSLTFSFEVHVPIYCLCFAASTTATIATAASFPAAILLVYYLRQLLYAGSELILLLYLDYYL